MQLNSLSITWNRRQLYKARYPDYPAYVMEFVRLRVSPLPNRQLLVDNGAAQYKYCSEETWSEGCRV
jgi:hypothetical protein